MTQYFIHIRGHLDKRWGKVLSGFDLTHEYTPTEGPITIVSGDVVDQAALYGLISRFQGLGIELISVQPNLKEENEDEK